MTFSAQDPDRPCPDWARPLLQRMPPAGVPVVHRSTPVLAFGDPTTARVATLGLNPSADEFVGKWGLLTGAERRFETLDSLGLPPDVTSLADAPDDVTDRAWAGLCGYFHRQPYGRWFGVLESVLAATGASYWAGTACHLDLSPWATAPKWGDLGKGERARLVADGSEFLTTILRHTRPAALVLNGRGVVNALAATFSLRLDVVARLAGPARRTTELLAGAGPQGIPVFAWSVNLQSSFGVTLGLRSETSVALARWMAGEE